MTTNDYGMYSIQDVLFNIGDKYEVQALDSEGNVKGKAIVPAVKTGYTSTANIVQFIMEMPGNLKGVVTNAIGQPIEGAEVSVEGLEKTSDEYGNFEFRNLAPEEYTVIAEAEGETRTETATIFSNETTNIVIQLPIYPPELIIDAEDTVTSESEIKVTVTLEGEVVVGATVTLGDQTEYTDNNGEVTIKAPSVQEDTSMTISAEHEGITGYKEITVTKAPGIPAPGVIAVICAIAIAFGLVALYRRKRR